ncbi:MAG: LmeA family phospholipid-binding protein, partial [Microcystaceae cyanobacterium]
MTSIVLGSLPFPSQSGDQLVSKAVSAAIAALFKRTGKLEANVKAEPVAKLLQGSIDGFDFIGNSMLMYNGLPIEAMELYVQAVSIDFSAIFKGQVKLRQPTQATMRIVLTEADLTTSFNTPCVVEKLQQLQYQG